MIARSASSSPRRIPRINSPSSTASPSPLLIVIKVPLLSDVPRFHIQSALHCREEIFVEPWLRNNDLSPGAPLAQLLIGSRACREDHLQPGSKAAALAQQGLAIHDWHENICDQEINRLSRRKDPEDLMRISRGDQSAREAFERLFNGAQYSPFVVHDQYGLHFYATLSVSQIIL